MDPTRGDEVMEALLAGNRRYAAGRSRHPHQRPVRRRALVAGQRPAAAVLGCADSRVAPEILFDCGLGDLFVVRVAGNVASASAIGSLEYAAEHLGVSLLVVLGHARCGAVTAAVRGGSAPGQVSTIVGAIAPAVAQIRGRCGDPVDNAGRAHVSLVAAQLRAAEPILACLVREGKLLLVGGYYDLETGLVEVLDPGPRT